MDTTTFETGNETIDNGIEKAGNFLTNAFSKAVETITENPEAAIGAAAGFLFGGIGGAALGAGLGYLAKQFFGAADPTAAEQRIAATQEATGVEISGQQMPAVDASGPAFVR